jgi:hypothetical protein
MQPVLPTAVLLEFCGAALIRGLQRQWHDWLA